MEDWQNDPNVKPLTELPVPSLNEEQLNLFTNDNLHISKVMDFNPESAVNLLANLEGKKVLAADFGGDKGICRLFEVKDGKLVVVDGYEDDIQGNDGIGYLDTIKKASKFADINDIPFGISWGGPIDGYKMLFHPKATVFFDELTAEFNGDFKSISTSIKTCLNDGPAGLISGAVEAYREYKSTETIFIINGGGIGLGALKNNIIYSTEAGHLEALASLNKYNQDTPCGVFDAQYTCLERLGANKAGIETQWLGIKGEYSRARDIEDRYKEGDKLAAELYDNSAYVLAHIIQGSANALDINIASNNCAIVCHGGAFKFPNYSNRINQILSQNLHNKLNMILTHTYADKRSNACLDGAAIAAIIS